MHSKAFTTWTCGPLCDPFINRRGELIGVRDTFSMMYGIMHAADGRHFLFVPFPAQSRTYRPGRRD